MTEYNIIHPTHTPIPIMDNDNLASIHRQKCLLGSCVIQHPTARDLGGVLPICVSGKKQTDLSPSWGPCIGPWISSCPSWLQSGSCWRTLPLTVTHNRAFMEVHFSSGEVPAQIGAKNLSLHALERVRGTVWFKRIPASPGWHSSEPREIFSAHDST